MYVHMCMRGHREWCDFQITSHAPFMVAIALAFWRGSYDVCLLVAAVVVSSVGYHRGREKKGAVAAVDSLCAKSLFLYGLIQVRRATCPAMAVGMALLASATAGTYVFTHFYTDKKLYERVHPFGLHVVPGVWAMLVALYSPPLLWFA